MTDKAKIRRNITLNVEEMTVRIAEHTGTLTEGDYEEITSVVYSTNALPGEIAKRCEIHGLAQKLSDCTAGMSDAKGHTSAARFEKIDELFSQLTSGEWAKKNSDGGVAKQDKENGKIMRAKYNHPDTDEATRMILASIMNIEYKALS